MGISLEFLKQPKYHFLTSCWSIWIILTLVYIPLSVLVLEASYLIALPIYVLGLFVPIGYLSAQGILILSSESIQRSETNWVFLTMYVVIFIYVMYLANKKSRALFPPNIAPFKRIGFNLAALFLITLLTDLAFYGTWMSLMLVIKGNIAFSSFF